MEIEKTDSAKNQETNQAPRLMWATGAEVFEDLLIRHLCANDKISAIMALDEMSRDAACLLASGNANAEENTLQLLNMLALTTATSVRFQERLLFEACVRTAFSIFMSGFDERGGIRNTRDSVNPMSSALFWVEMAKRIIAIGGFAVRRGDWGAVRRLALQRIDDRRSVSFGKHQYWLRHATREADNSGSIYTTNARHKQKGPLIAATLELVNSAHYLHPDLPSDDHRLLKSLLGFDLLAALIVTADAGEFSTSFVDPGFIYWDVDEVGPLLARLLRDKEMREELFTGGFTDEFFSRTLRELDNVGDRNSSGWSGWTSRAVIDFLSKHPIPSSNG